MSTSIEVPPLPLQAILGTYPYQQYADDVNVCAFFTATNAIAQTYLDWFNNNPLGVYTNPNIGGSAIPNILDWIGVGIYGIARPVFSTLSSSFLGAINDFGINEIEINGSRTTQSGTAIPATDDYYKRTMTWILYRGDGPYMTTIVLRRRIARFLFGVNGTDITPDQAQLVSIVPVNFSPTIANGTINITLPPGIASQYFVSAFNQGLLPFPAQLNAGISTQ